MAEVDAGRSFSDRKKAFRRQLEQLLETHSKVLIVDADNVGSQQMHEIRASLRGKATILMGKNTMLRFCINSYAKEVNNDNLAKLADLCRLNVGLVFTNSPLSEVRDLLIANRKLAAAKVGAVAQSTVTIPAGPTGLEPTQTSFFQALQIPTKIVKGSIEILNPVELVTEGQRCKASQVALLNKLNIRPFSYGLVVKSIYDDGSVYAAAVLDITSEDIAESIAAGIANIAAFSLQTGIVTAPAFPHLVVNAFKDCLAVAAETEYTFPQAEKMKEFLADPSKFAVAAAPAAATSAAAAAPEPEPEEEEDEDMGFSLFD